MNSVMYEYVVLRLSSNAMRGEHINVGVVVFPEGRAPQVKITAPIAKIQAVDPDWNSDKERGLLAELSSVMSSSEDTKSRIALLAALGFCVNGEPGFFYATDSSVEAEIRELSRQYVLTRPPRVGAARRSKLHREIADRFRHMGILGTSMEELAQHRVVPHVAIPGNPDLKGDFVYKNGVYRITQTLDYRVSSVAAHQKVAEACTKVMAAAEGVRAWGSDTQKFAVVCVPGEVADVADPHLDLLYASGFQIFHADQPADLARYYETAFPA